ncbi:MAG: NADH-quinone oxidoreductase subunit L [Acidobacteriota bacterium]|nr:MAG: NADH-quinone oxidoreductase subunit L [Acidobacteriota bacterium]
MLPYLLLIPLAPLLGFVLVGVLGASGLLTDRWVHRIAVAASLAALVFSCAAVWEFSSGLDHLVPLAEEDPGRFLVQPDEGDSPARFSVTYAPWIPLGDTLLRGWSSTGERTASLTVGWTLSFDALTAIMLLVVAGVGTLIHVYSIGYMAGDPGYSRFFAYMNLFMAMMLTLVLGGNILVMFIGWEGVGLCSFLLISYYYDQVFDRESGLTCADAGRKAFITNRIGDMAFVLGGLLLLITFGTFDFYAISDAIDGSSEFWYASLLLTGVGLLLFIGATGKSAQIPLYVWLPDAMAGPTPVSALIHAATMVTAGVYMLARMSSLFWHAPGAMLVVAVVGCLTAVFAATMGMAQYDIKKALAYSTVSQLGYMFLGAGVGAFVAAIFHLVTHAFFKACLFLGSGSVILRAGHSNDMRLYGGLKKWMPVTYATFLISTLAIAGFPLMSGFMSKDEILARSLFSTRGHTLLWLFGTFGAVMTSFYMFRAVYMTFHGENRSPEWVRHQLKESPRVMTGVLAVLAAGALFVGFLGVPEGVSKLVGLGNVNWFEHQLHPVVAARGVVAAASHGEHGGQAGVDTHEDPAADSAYASALTADEATGHGEPQALEIDVIREGLVAHPTLGQEWALFGVGLGVFLAGLGLASWAYGNNMRRAAAMAGSLGFVRRLLHRKWFVDELYDKLVIGPFKALCRGADAIDRTVVDGAVNLAGILTEISGQVIKLFQTGVVRHYAVWLLAGTVLVLWIVMG